MKKLLFLPAFALATTALLTSCDRSNDDTLVSDNSNAMAATTYDIKGAAMTKTSARLYTYNRTFTTPLYNTDVVLIYRQAGVDNGNPVWQLLPKTYYFPQGSLTYPQGALDYTADFTKNDIAVYANADFDISAQDATFQSTYITGQNFRIVVIPSNNGGSVTGKNSVVNYADYKAVAAYYHISENGVKSL